MVRSSALHEFKPSQGAFPRHPSHPRNIYYPSLLIIAHPTGPPHRFPSPSHRLPSLRPRLNRSLAPGHCHLCRTALLHHQPFFRPIFPIGLFIRPVVDRSVRDPERQTPHGGVPQPAAWKTRWPICSDCRTGGGVGEEYGGHDGSV